MVRTIEYKIANPPAGQKVKGFLKKKDYSEQSIRILKAGKEAVFLNGQPARMEERIKDGDSLTVNIRETENSDQIMPVALPLDIVYEDEDLLIINKSAGMPIHPSAGQRDNTLGNALAWYFKQKNQPFVFRCINRLDQDTSGLTIVAKHIVSAGILGNRINQKSETGMCREYLGIVRGIVSPQEGVIDAPIGTKEGPQLERTIDFIHGDRAVTHYRVIQETKEHSLVLLRLETGRTHQIRVHMRYLGYPLIGDYLYNPDMEHIKRQALHAFRLAFCHPMTGDRMEFEVPMPEDMLQVLHF